MPWKNWEIGARRLDHASFGIAIIYFVTVMSPFPLHLSAVSGKLLNGGSPSLLLLTFGSLSEIQRQSINR